MSIEINGNYISVSAIWRSLSPNTWNDLEALVWVGDDQVFHYYRGEKDKLEEIKARFLA